MGFIKILMAVFVIGFLLSPKIAQAQYASGIDIGTLRDALDGNSTAISKISAALGNPSYPISTATFLNDIRTQLGGSTATRDALFNNAIALDTTALNTIQGALGGALIYSKHYKKMGSNNAYDDLLNYIIAGSGNLAVVTVRQALAGNGNAQKVLNVVLNSSPFSNTIFMADLNAAIPGAVSVFDDALSTSATAAASAQKINSFSAALLTSNNLATSKFLDGPALAFVTGFNVAGSSTTNKDTDADGIPDNIDSDIDGDGVPNTYDTDMNGDGTADNTDTDGDGTPDAVDPTPTGGNPTDATGTGGGTGTGGTGGTGTAGGSSKPPTNDCDPDADAPLTGSFGTNPCELTEDTLALVDDKYFDEAGKQFVDHLNQWWTDAMLPSMKNMTAQWHSSVIDQSRQFGTAIDSHNVTSQVKGVQTRELEARKAVLPNERTCVGASAAAPLANTGQSATVLASALGHDVAKRSGGAPGTPTATGNNVEDMKARIKTYCDNFNDPDANAGSNLCPAPTTKGKLVNGDVDVEGFLLKDTVDLKEPEQYAAAKELITNLIDPKPIEKLPEEVIDTTSGHEYLIRKEHVKALRAVAANVVSSIISRRVSIPLPKTAGGAAPPPTPPPPTPPAPPPTSGSKGNYDQFLDALGIRENGGSYKGCNGPGFCGKYQMGRAALVDIGCVQSAGPWPADARNNYNSYPWIAGNANCNGVTSIGQFLNCGPCQEKAIRANMVKKHGFIGSSTWANGACKMIKGVWVTPSGMLAGAHLVGQGGVKCFVDGTSCSSVTLKNGLPVDGNGVSIVEYMNLLGGYDTPFGGATCGPGASSGFDTSTATATPPKPPRPVGDIIREIRLRAGVDPALISDNPSYNEIMLAMTKERFLDPDYYTRMANDVGAIKQEETSVRSYISIQLQDIYTLQEQINALMAARAAMKIEATGSPNQSTSVPVK